MIEIHLIQRKCISFKLWQYSINKQQKQIFCIHEGLFLLVCQSEPFEWLQIVYQFIFQMSKGTTDSIHFDQALVKIKAISHEETVEWEALDRFLDGLVHKMSAACEQVCQQLVTVKTWNMWTTLVEVSFIVLVVFLSVFTCHVMNEVFEPIKRGLLEIIRREADFVAVHKDSCQFDPI